MSDAVENSVVAAADTDSEAKKRMEEKVAEMLANGYVEVTEFNNLKVGARVCHSGQRWYEARVHGTATIERILHKPVSSWSQKYNRPDIELVAKRDKSDFTGDEYGYWADYHAVLVTPDEEI